MAATTTRRPVNSVDNTMVYRIEVYKPSRDEWITRGFILATSPNNALRRYGLRGSRPRLGSAVSASGKRFRAINTGNTSMKGVK